MLSAGMAIPQKANDARPPERKFAVPVLISYGDPVNRENPRIKALLHLWLAKEYQKLSRADLECQKHPEKITSECEASR